LSVLGHWEQLGESISWHLACFDPSDDDASGSEGWIGILEDLTEPVLLDIDVLELG
jgi:hypothetical protein